MANVVLIGALGALWLEGAVPVLVAAALLVWGLVGFGLVPSLQYRVVSLAGDGRDLAATLPAPEPHDRVCGSGYRSPNRSTTLSNTARSLGFGAKQTISSKPIRR